MRKAQSVLLVVSLIITMLWNVRSQTPITCTAGHYTPGEKATITCYYHEEVSTEQTTGLHITWYKLGAPKDASGNEVLECYPSADAVSVCKPEKGYRFIGISKNNLTIEVPDVSAEFQGRYSCGVIPGDGRAVRPCVLLVEGAYEPEKSTQRSPGTQGTLHEHVKTIHALMVLTFILMTVAVAAIIYLTLAYKKRWFPFKRKDQIQIADAETILISNEENGNGEQLSVGFRPDTLGSVNNPLPGPVLEPELQGGSTTVVEEEPAEENKPETEKERKEREKQEKKERADRRTERENELKERIKHATSKEESKRIQKEYDEMYTRSHMAEREERKRIREQYDALTKGLKNATSEEEKKQIQSKYDDQKKQWKYKKEQNK